MFKKTFGKLRDTVNRFEYGYLLFAFLLPALIMWLIFIAMEVYPFGTNSVLVLDLNGQYVYFFEELRDKVLNGGSLLYTWNRSIGGEFMGMYAYYLASPFSFLICLFSEEHITEGLLLIMLLKVGSMGATMAYYLHQISHTSKLRIISLSMCYALCGYMIAFGHNTMWVDNLILLPLVALGIERLICRQKFGLYVVSLSLCMLSNFYIGYMMCIFCALYFFYYYFAHNRKFENNFYMEENHFWRSLLRMAVYSGIVIMISMIIWYPAYTSLQFGKSSFSKPNFTFSQNFDLLDFFTKFFPGSYDTVRPAGLPFVYCGTVALMLLPLYFLTSRIRARERLLSGYLLLILLFSFDCSAVDIVWHGFQRPNWLNYRYSFMFVFLMLVFSYKALEYIGKLNFKYVVIDAALLGIILMLIQKQDYEYISDLKCIWFSVACLAAYVVVLYMECKGSIGRASSAILLATVCVELFVSGLFGTIALDQDVVISSRTSYNSYMEKVRPLVEYVQAYDTSPFYRMEKNFHRKTNDSMALHFHGLSNSTSTLNASTVKLLREFGYSSTSHWSKYLGGHPVSDSIFDLKYIISEGVQSTELYNLIKSDEKHNYYVYENPYALSLAFAADRKTGAFNMEAYHSPFERMNALVGTMLGQSEPVPIYVPYEDVPTTLDNIDVARNYVDHWKYGPTVTGKTASVTFTLTARPHSELFCYFATDYPRECKISVNGKSLGSYFGSDSNRVFSLGVYEEEQEVKVTLTLKEDEPIYLRNKENYFYSVDYDAFRSSMQKLQQGGLNITSFADTEITGTITVPEEMTSVFATIPYDAGWKITVDGNEVQTYKALDSLTAFDIDAGTHEVRMVYSPKCYTVASKVSLIGVGLFGAAIVLDILRIRRRNRQWAEANGIF